MNTISQIRANTQAKATELFRQYGVFWAFSDQQFQEGLQKTHSQVADIVAIGAGGYVKKQNAHAYHQAMSKLIDTQIKAELATGRENVILYQLHNHEAFWCDDGLHSALSILVKDYNISKEEVMNVYHKHYDANDAW